jgi:hypothetical protein
MANAAAALRPGGLALVEARSVRDPRYGCGAHVGPGSFRDTHFRRFVHLPELVCQLEGLGFEVLAACEEFRAAAHKADRAVVARVVAAKRAGA